VAISYDASGKGTITAPESPSILKSVTTKSLVYLAEKVLKYDVSIRPVKFSELAEGKFDEVAAAGTAAAVTPVKSVSYNDKATGEVKKIKVGDGEKAGKGWVELRKVYTGIQSGDREDTFGWLWPKEGVKKGDE
jgi:branched-chain amino acid aminotransferase